MKTFKIYAGGGALLGRAFSLIKALRQAQGLANLGHAGRGLEDDGAGPVEIRVDEVVVAVLWDRRK